MTPEEIANRIAVLEKKVSDFEEGFKTVFYMRVAGTVIFVIMLLGFAMLIKSR